ncbi:MAG: HD domain-containing phosphohydrolase [Acidobacteriota bacterium]
MTTTEPAGAARGAVAAPPRTWLRIAPHLRVVLTRWVLVIAIAYSILFRGGTMAPLWPHQIFVAVLFLYNSLVTWLLGQEQQSVHSKARMLVTALDVAAVTLAITIAGNASTDFFLIYFAVIMLAAISHRLSVVAAVAVVICAIYGGLLYAEVGSALWRDSALLIRIPFLFGVAIFFGTVAQESVTEHSRAEKLEGEAERLSTQTQEMAGELDHLRALSEIGRLALTGSYPGPVLYEISRRIQDVVQVGRCSLVLFERDGSRGYLAASGDDPSVEVLLVSMDSYPELRAAFAGRMVTEIHPGEPKELWESVQKCLPETSSFRSFLVVPIQWGDSILGVFFLRDSHADRVFRDKDRDFTATAAVMVAGFVRAHDLVDKLRRQSREDGLTGLLNYPAFRQEAEKAIGARDSQSGPLSLLIADIDNIREINDVGGNAAGNRVICEVGERLADMLPAGSLIARYGGDEFIAMVATSKADSVKSVEQVLHLLERDPRARDLPQATRVSVGVVGFPDDGNGLAALVEAAWQAMYLAKNAGGHRVCTSESGADTEIYQRAVQEAAKAVEARREEQKQAGEVVGEVVEEAAALPEQLAGLQGATLDSSQLRIALTELADSVESKNPYIKDHSRSVSQLAGQLALAMGLDEGEVLSIEVAALAHDLGKMSIPDEVLNKNGKLSDEERRMFEEAPARAAQMLQLMPAMAPVVPLVLHHMERWDGSGYPGGLEGDAIPIGSQIIFVCDVYQTLLSPRAYRPALPEEQARQIIQRGAERQWDPQVVEKFLELLAQGPVSTVPAQPAAAQSAAEAR